MYYILVFIFHALRGGNTFLELMYDAETKVLKEYYRTKLG